MSCFFLEQAQVFIEEVGIQFFAGLVLKEKVQPQIEAEMTGRDVALWVGYEF